MLYNLPQNCTCVDPCCDCISVKSWGEEQHKGADHVLLTWMYVFQVVMESLSFPGMGLFRDASSLYVSGPLLTIVSLTPTPVRFVPRNLMCIFLTCWSCWTCSLNSLNVHFLLAKCWALRLGFTILCACRLSWINVWGPK